MNEIPTPYQDEQIVTERLTLQTPQPEDIPALTRLWTDKAVRAHLGGITDAKTAELKAQAQIGKAGSFSVHESVTSEVIGLSTIDRYRTGDLEVSYQLVPEAWGKGYGREAVAATIHWGFDHHDDNRIIAVTQSANAASRKLLKSVGMTLVDEFEEFGEPQSMYAINRDAVTS